MMKKFEPAGAVHVPPTVCLPGPAAVALGTLICVLNETIAAALYFTFFAKRMLSFALASSGFVDVLMKCMLRTIWVPAAKGRPTVAGIFMPTTSPGVDVA